MAVFTLGHSNECYVRLFHYQNQLAFMESERNFFRKIKNVSYIMAYDNMHVDIKKFAREEKKSIETLLRMKNSDRYHYHFYNTVLVEKKVM